MARSIHDVFNVRRPDYIPDGHPDELLCPHLGGAYHDYIPEGQNGIDMHGRTYDAVPVSTEPIPPHAPEKVKK